MSASLSELARQRLANADVEGAITAYSQCLILEPENSAILNNLGVALIKAGRFKEAIDALERALALRPTYHRALTNLGKAMREVGRFAEAVSRLQQAIAIEPNHAPALVNLADALAATGQLDAAEQALDRAIQISPALVEAHLTLGIVRLQSSRVHEAIASLRTALALAPAHADAHANLAHALFFSGDWEAAWPHFEYRFQRNSYRSGPRVPRGMVRWDGAVAGELELWLIAEQGLGDQLQFARYTKVLSAQGVQCVIACDPRLVKILTYAEIAARVVPFGTVSHGSNSRYIPLLSLPAWHRTRADTVPASKGYLSADESRVRLWGERLADARGLRVALAWAGNPSMETGRYVGRSPPLAAMVPLMNVPDVSFISVQKNAGEEQLDSVPFGNRILRFRDLDTGPDAFLDTAAVLKCVDLVVTSDTAIAHLAGALNVPTWLCLMHEPDWRWMGSGSATAWYASMRIFRQHGPGNWASVFSDVAKALALHAATRS
jgi:tetratricopeptide (TPR) repeat protein